MEALPDEVLHHVLGCLGNVRAIASFALASKSCRDAIRRIELVRKIDLPVKQAYNATHPDNVQFVKDVMSPGHRYCTYCRFCHEIIPVPMEAIVFDHKCHNRDFWYTKPTHIYVLLYRGNTQHLMQPDPSTDVFLRLSKIPRPNVFPYALKSVAD